MLDWPDVLSSLTGVSRPLREAATQAVRDVQPLWDQFSLISFRHTGAITRAFHEVRLDERHFQPTTGYGYGDAGREALERVYALVFGAEAALVRQQVVSGTHALSLCLGALLAPGDLLVSAAGAPYDTLLRVIGAGSGDSRTLCGSGIRYSEAVLTAEGRVDLQRLREVLAEGPKVVLIQRSRGYSLAPSRTLADIDEIIRTVRSAAPAATVLVDNCYGEFVEPDEPTAVGADLIAGSLIKNPGGGLAPSGGYVAGKEDAVNRVAQRLYAPTIGGEIGPSLISNRPFFQGFYLAPHFVAQALMGAAFAARLAELCGYRASPAFDAPRTDIIQAIELGTPEAVARFCRGLQEASPVGAHIVPEPAPMPGYGDPIIMAGGTFIQGASLELSADAPMRPPFSVFLQGGYSVEQVIGAVISAFERLRGKA